MRLAWIIIMAAVAPAMAQVELPPPSDGQPIVVTAEAANRWTEGQYEVYLLRGNCRICQGNGCARSSEAAIWIDRAQVTGDQRSKVIAYLEGGVCVEPDRGLSRTRLIDEHWLGRFYTNGVIQVHAGRVAERPDEMPAVFQRGVQRRAPSPVRHVQFQQGAATQVQPIGPGATPPVVGSPVAESASPGARRIRVFPRGDVPVQAQWFPDPAGNQWIAVIDSGVNLIVDGLPEFGSLDVVTDRLVIWTNGLDEPDLTGQRAQEDQIPLEIYMEGNVVFRQGERVIYAERMYYDVANRVGIVLKAEMLTPVQSYEGLLRLKAEMIQQTGRDTYFARDAFMTSSRMGRPGYRVQSGNIEFQDHQYPAIDPFTGRPLIDPATGEQVIEHDRLATARNNFLFLGPVPVFYWPVLATDVTDPTFFIRNVRVKNDNVYGTQLLTTWNTYELLGIRRPPAGTDWDLSLDYLGDRGLGHGTTFIYNRDWSLGVAGRNAGLFDYWGIKDRGLDNLGRGRRNLVPECDYRHRLFWNHRHLLANDLQVSVEAGWISDRNFLEQYFEREWDELKDQTTGIEVKQIRDNTAWSVNAEMRINDFFTQTEWFPRADHFWLGQSLLGDTLTWYEHTSVGFARLRNASADPYLATWDRMPWERDSRQGERLLTRQEIDWPVQLGPVKVVPYALGELAHWGEDVNGDDLQRAYYQAGIRASMPMWRVNPLAESGLLNVHGLSHKVVFDAELSFAEANRDLQQLPLYDPLDDDSVEAFRRMFTPVPWRLDPRNYAVRTGMAGWVTAPSSEVADDLAALRLGMRHRWQTKRGMPGCRRIVDWITLDTNVTWFPDEDRDNFGKSLGLLDYDFRWHVGDRLTLVSDGVFDFFTDGQKVVNIGGFLSRPPRGSLYAGLRLAEGPISTHVLSMSYAYWMSPKWVSSFGTSIDLGGEGNIGQRFSITRIGESLLISVGFNVDAARDNVGINFAIEPRFLPANRLSRIGGTRIPVAGAHGLE